MPNRIQEKRRKFSDMSPAQQRKFKQVMREFAEGKLRSSDGSKVSSRDQALAIAFSKAGRIR